MDSVIQLVISKDFKRHLAGDFMVWWHLKSTGAGRSKEMSCLRLQAHVTLLSGSQRTNGYPPYDGGGVVYDLPETGM